MILLREEEEYKNKGKSASKLRFQKLSNKGKEGGWEVRGEEGEGKEGISERTVARSLTHCSLAGCVSSYVVI